MTPTAPTPIPTFPDRHPSREASFATAIRALDQGIPAAADLVGLSDLTRDEIRQFRERWADLSEAIRIKAIRTMTGLVDERVDVDFGRVLRVGLDDESAIVRQLAVAALWEDQGSDLCDRFVELVRRDASDDVRAEAARALGPICERIVNGQFVPPRDADPRTALSEAAGEGEASFTVRRRAIESLGVFGAEPDIQAAIREAYESGEQDLMASALFAMGQGLDRRWLPTVLAELHHSEAELRYEAARAAGRFGDDAAVTDLIELTGDEDSEVRFAAIAALGQIGGRGAITALRRLQSRADNYDAEAIEAALDEANLMVDPLRVGE